MAAPRRPAKGQALQWIALSAQSPEQLVEYAGKLADFIDFLDEAPQLQHRYRLEDIAHSLATGRTHFPVRLLVAARSLQDLQRKLRAFDGHAKEADGIHAGTAKPGRSAPPRRTDARRLASAWVAGELPEFPFAPGPTRQKLPLPTYPFLRERSWPSHRAALVADQREAGGAASLHPLVDANVSTLRKQEFRKTLLKSDYYLKDHLVANKHVVPGVCHLEIATAAARLALESESVTSAPHAEQAHACWHVIRCRCGTSIGRPGPLPPPCAVVAAQGRQAGRASADHLLVVSTAFHGTRARRGLEGAPHRAAGWVPGSTAGQAPVGHLAGRDAGQHHAW